jgi:hypothetical protein
MLFVGARGQVFPEPSCLSGLQIINDPHSNPLAATVNGLGIEIDPRLFIAVHQQPLCKDGCCTPALKNGRREEDSREERSDGKISMVALDRLTSWLSSR